MNLCYKSSVGVALFLVLRAPTLPYTLPTTPFAEVSHSCWPRTRPFQKRELQLCHGRPRGVRTVLLSSCPHFHPCSPRVSASQALKRGVLLQSGILKRKHGSEWPGNLCQGHTGGNRRAGVGTRVSGSSVCQVFLSPASPPWALWLQLHRGEAVFQK